MMMMMMMMFLVYGLKWDDSRWWMVVGGFGIRQILMH